MCNNSIEMNYFCGLYKNRPEPTKGNTLPGKGGFEHFKCKYKYYLLKYIHFVTIFRQNELMHNN